MNREEKNIKKSLIKAVNSVRQKFRDLHIERSGEELKNVEIFKPITGKLETLIGMQSASKPSTAAAAATDAGFENGQRNRQPMKKKKPLKRLVRVTRTQPKRRGISKPIQAEKNAEQLKSLMQSLLANVSDTSSTAENDETITTRKSAGDVSSPEYGPEQMIVAKPKGRIKKSPPPLSALPQPGTSTSMRAATSPVLISSSSSSSEESDVGRDKSDEVDKVTPNRYVHLRNKIFKVVKPNVLKQRTRKKAHKIQSAPYVRPIAKDSSDPSSEKSGAGILPTNWMRYHKNNKNNSYTHWDDPNELVDRLRLLVASKSAGHSGHTNEILSIVEELREAHIIA